MNDKKENGKLYSFSKKGTVSGNCLVPTKRGRYGFAQIDKMKVKFVQ